MEEVKGCLLQVTLEQKKDELKQIRDKLHRAECTKQRVLQTASALVRSQPRSQLDPIWVEGLDYPAQYVVRHTRSMTKHSGLPTLHTPSEITNFELPNDVCAPKASVNVVLVSEHSEQTMELSSVIKVDTNNSVVGMVQCRHGNSLTVAVVCEYAVSVFAVRENRWSWQWREHLESPVCIGRMVSTPCGWLLVAVGGCLTNTLVRVYLWQTESIVESLSLADSSDSDLLPGVCDLTVWSKAHQCSGVAAVTTKCTLLVWQVQHDGPKWSESLVAVIKSPMSGIRQSLSYVHGTEALLVWMVGDTLLLCNGLSGGIQSQHPLGCDSKPVSHGNLPNVIWASQEKNVVCVCLGVTGTEQCGAWVLTLTNSGLKLLHTFQLANERCTKFTCTERRSLLAHTTDHQLKVFAIDSNQCDCSVRVSGCPILACEWSDGYYVGLCDVGYLYFFKSASSDVTVCNDSF